MDDDDDDIDDGGQSNPEVLSLKMLVTQCKNKFLWVTKQPPGHAPQQLVLNL